MIYLFQLIINSWFHIHTVPSNDPKKFISVGVFGTEFLETCVRGFFLIRQTLMWICCFMSKDEYFSPLSITVGNLGLHCRISNYLQKHWTAQPFLTINLKRSDWRAWLVPQLYIICCLQHEKQNRPKFILQPKPRQLIDTQTKLRKLQSAALIDGWTWKVACLFPLCAYSIKPRPVWLAGINMHGDSVSPLFSTSVWGNSLSVFLCLSRCYPSGHRWARQTSGPLHFVFINLRVVKGDAQKRVCRGTSLHRPENFFFVASSHFRSLKSCSSLL